MRLHRPQAAQRTAVSRRPLRRAGAAGALALLAALALSACGSKQDTLTAASARPFAVALRGPAAPEDAALYRALADGDFRAVGLEVRPVASAGPAQALQALAAGQVQMAVTSEPELLLARDRGERIVAVGALVQRSLDSLVALPGTRLSGAGALAQRTVGTLGLPWPEDELTAMLAHARMPASSVHRLILAGGALTPALTSRRVSATFGGSWAGQAVKLRLSGRAPLVVHPEQAGVPAYQALVLAVPEPEARADGEALRSFLQALTRGQRRVQADPASGAAAVRAANPALTEPFTVESLRALLPAAKAPAGQPFGWQETASWAGFGSWMHSQGLLTADPSSGGLPPFTNEYLPGQGI